MKTIFLEGQVAEQKRLLAMLLERHRRQQYDLLTTETRIKENVDLLEYYERGLENGKTNANLSSLYRKTLLY